jgi:hypothetical protein
VSSLYENIQDDDGMCMDYYRIAGYLLDNTFSSPDEMVITVMTQFHMSHDTVKALLGSRSFNSILNQMIRAKEIMQKPLLINYLVKLMETGSNSDRLQACKLIANMKQQEEFKKNRKKAADKIKNKSIALEDVHLQESIHKKRRTVAAIDLDSIE